MIYFTKYYWCQYISRDKIGKTHNLHRYIINSEKIWVWKQGNMQGETKIPRIEKKKII